MNYVISISVSFVNMAFYIQNCMGPTAQKMTNSNNNNNNNKKDNIESITKEILNYNSNNNNNKDNNNKFINNNTNSNNNYKQLKMVVVDTITAVASIVTSRGATSII